MCSRKNFVFLFGALINLTVRVDVYFHPIRMTYPIQPDHFSWQHQIGEKPPNTLPRTFFEQDRRNYCPLSSLAAASRHHEESHLIYGPLESILIDQGFPFDYELDEFNPPHTGTTLSRLQFWLCRLRRKIPLRHPAPSSLGNIFWRHSLVSLSPNHQDHTFMDDDNVPALNQQTRLLLHLWRPYLTHTFNNALTVTLHVLLKHLAAKIPSQLHHYFLPSFLRDLQHK